MVIVDYKIEGSNQIDLEIPEHYVRIKEVIVREPDGDGDTTVTIVMEPLFDRSKHA